MKLIDILTPDRNCLPAIILKYFKDQSLLATSFCFLFLPCVNVVRGRKATAMLVLAH